MRSGRRNRFASRAVRLLFALVLLAVPASVSGQTATPPVIPAAPALPEAPIASVNSASISGTVTDVQSAIIPGARIALENATAQVLRTASSDQTGGFVFAGIAPGEYILKVTAPSFAPWKIKDIIVLHEGEIFTVPVIELGVEEITTTVNAITQEDLAEQQITAEEHQRILGILPNFYVSYLSDAAPLTRKQKFKLAFTVRHRPADLSHHRRHGGD